MGLARIPESEASGPTISFKKLWPGLPETVHYGELQGLTGTVKTLL